MPLTFSASRSSTTAAVVVLFVISTIATTTVVDALPDYGQSLSSTAGAGPQANVVLGSDGIPISGRLTEVFRWKQLEFDLLQAPDQGI